MRKIFLCLFTGSVLPLQIFQDSLALLASDNKHIKKEPFKPTSNSVAYFDYFVYKGVNDFYAQNSLPDKDYFYNPILPGWYPIQVYVL